MEHVFTGELWAAKAGDPLPVEFQIFPLGTVTFTAARLAPLPVDRAAVAAAVAAFAAAGRDLVVDFEHQTLGGEWASPTGVAPAAGWIKRLLDKGEQGLWAAVEWTDRAAALLAAREYRFFSPVFERDARGRLARIVNLALTNDPATRGIRPLVAKNAAGDPPAEEANMDFMLELKKLLGLPEDATPEAMLDAVKALQAPPDAAKDLAAVREALGVAKDAPAGELTGTIHALKARPGDELLAKVQRLEDDAASARAEQMVAKAMEAGKVVPANRAEALAFAQKDPAGFEVFMAKAPQVVDLAAAKREQPPKNSAAALTAEQREAARALSLSDAEFRKHNGL